MVWSAQLTQHRERRMGFQSIRPLLNAHEVEIAWLFGKAPSLDEFPMATAGPLRIVINESLRAVPQSACFFARDEDPIANVATDWSGSCKASLRPVRAEFALRCVIPGASLHVYTKRTANNAVRDMNATQIAESASLYGNSGTVHCAIHFCRLLGAARIVMVGFDGKGGYAAKVGLPDGGAEHGRIRRDSISLMTTLDIPHQFFESRSEISP